MKRPPVAWSMTVAALASTDGWRNVADSTAWPSHLPGTWWARRGHRRERLERRAGPLPPDVGQVVVHPDAVEHVVLADPRPGRFERRPVDALWRGLDPDLDRAAPCVDRHGLSARAGPAVIRVAGRHRARATPSRRAPRTWP